MKNDKSSKSPRVQGVPKFHSSRVLWRSLLLLLVLMVNGQWSTVNGQTYAYPYLAFETTDGEVLSVAVEGLTIALNDATLTATDSEGAAYTFALSSLGKMHFTDEATGIQPLASTSQEPVEAYTTPGVYVGKYSNVAKARSTLPYGIYILKGKTFTLKMTVR